MIFKMIDCDFGFKYNGVTYDFSQVDSFTIENPRKTRITRGANATDKVGITYVEGAKEPNTLTVTILNLTQEIKAVLDEIFNEKARADVFAVNRYNGSKKMLSNAVLCQEPQQLTLDDTAESMNVALVWESFDMSEVHKA